MKFINISNQLYYLIEIKRLVKADPTKEYEFTEDEIGICPLLRDMINQGKIIQVPGQEIAQADMSNIRILGATDEQLQDGSIRQELQDLQQNHNAKSPTDNNMTYDVGRTQVPVFHTQESPLVEEQPKRDILIDEYQREHQRSLYDDPSEQKKK